MKRGSGDEVCRRIRLLSLENAWNERHHHQENPASSNTPSRKVYRRPSSKEKRSKDEASLPWNDPQKQRRRIPIVGKAPFMLDRKKKRSYSAGRIRPGEKLSGNRARDNKQRPKSGFASSSSCASNILLRSNSLSQVPSLSSASTVQLLPPQGKSQNQTAVISKSKSKCSLTIDVDAMKEEEDALEETFEFTESGVFKVGGFEIHETGLTRTPEKERAQITPGKVFLRHRSTPAPRASSLKSSMIKCGVLGKGSSGVVHKMLHVPTFKFVAVKTIPCFEKSKRRQMVKELQALCENTASLSSKSTSAATRDANNRIGSIVTFYDAYMNPEEGSVSLVEEYMSGGSLQRFVDQGAVLSEIALSSVANQVLLGLKHLHGTRRMHRDIKPSNILYRKGTGEVKLSDFGIAKRFGSDEDDNSLSEADTFVGTVSYMSPERIAGEPYGKSSDIWGLGLTLLACRLGKFPVEHTGGYWGLLQKLRNENVRVPEDAFKSPLLRDFICRCVRRDPKSRPTAGELLAHELFSTRAVLSSKGENLAGDRNDGSRVGDGVAPTKDLGIVSDAYARFVAAENAGRESSFHGKLVCPRHAPSARHSRELASALGLPHNVVRARLRRSIELAMPVGGDGKKCRCREGAVTKSHATRRLEMTKEL